MIKTIQVIRSQGLDNKLLGIDEIVHGWDV